MDAASRPTAPEAPPAPDQGMDRVLVKGIAWTGAAKYLTQILRWASTIVVARYLVPDDYGIFMMALPLLGLLDVLTEFGVGTAVITLRDLDDEDLAQLNGLAVLFGIAACLVTCALAMPLSLFYGAPELTLVVVILSVGFVVRALRNVPSALLQRELRFKRIAFLEAIEAVVLAGTVAGFAIIGLGYWTLVLGHLLGNVLGTVLLLAQRRHRFAWPRLGRIGRALLFSGHVVVSRLTWFWYMQADKIVAGRFLGGAALGAYGFAHELASVPVEKITVLVGRVAPAFLSAVQDDDAALRRYVLNITEGLAFLTIPACWGIALVADSFVPVVLGENWLPAIMPLRLLAIYAAWRSIEALLHTVLFVKKEARYGARTGLVCAVVLPVAFFVGQKYGGTGGVAAAWMVAHPLLLLPLYRFTLKKIGLSPWRYLGALWPSVCSALAMTAVVLSLRRIAPLEPLALRLGVEVAAGAAAYAAAMLLLFRGRLARFRQGLRALRG